MTSVSFGITIRIKNVNGEVEKHDREKLFVYEKLLLYNDIDWKSKLHFQHQKTEEQLQRQESSQVN